MLCSLPVSIESVVVLPAPLWPSRTVIWPSNMLSVKSLTASLVLFPTLNTCDRRIHSFYRWSMSQSHWSSTQSLPSVPYESNIIKAKHHASDDTFDKCLILTPDTSPAGSSSMNSPFVTFSASSSSSFSFSRATRGLLHQYEG